MTSKFDEWLTNEPEFIPIHHDYETVNDYVSEISSSANNDSASNYKHDVYILSIDNVDGLKCNSCHDFVGYVIDDTGDRVTGSYTDFWQIDCDGEILLCDGCYELTLEKDYELEE